MRVPNADPQLVMADETHYLTDLPSPMGSTNKGQISKRHLPRIPYKPHDKMRRFTNDKPEPNDERQEFERDRSRIIHSAAFRRLQGKTQVFTTGEGDFYRTRLTHSLEVAQIAKGLALRLGAHIDLVEAAALVHDIGHPPFGHAGEDALKELMSPYGGSEANAQNVRILTKLEAKGKHHEGLNLSRAVIDAQMKYKVPFAPERRKFVYKEDMTLVKWASDEARQVVPDLDSTCKSFECAIMDRADEVAYAVHDLEDSRHARYADATLLSQANQRVKTAIDAVASKPEYQDANVPLIYEDLLATIQKQDSDFHLFADMRTSRENKANTKTLTSFLIGRYIKAVSRSERISALDTTVSYRYNFAVEIHLSFRVEVALINALIKTIVIDSPQIRTLEEKGKFIVHRLFEKFMSGNGIDLLPDDWKEYLQASSSCDKDRASVVSDYISGMTGAYAQKTYAKLFCPTMDPSTTYSNLVPTYDAK